MATTDERGNLCLFPLHTAGGRTIKSDEEWQEVSRLHSIPTEYSGEAFCAVDFETYYSSKYSLRNLTTWNYVHHVAFDAYLVALEWFDGSKWWRWVGHPSKAPWKDILNILWVSHNASFDELVYWRSQELGNIPSGRPSRWLCTADLSIYIQAGRSLQLAVKNLFDTEISKEVREKMKGGGASDEESRDYAADDSFWCAKIWFHWSKRWSDQERDLCELTRYQGWRGINVDLPKIKHGIQHLESVKQSIQKEIPWGDKGPVTSYKQFCYECGRQGIEPPMSLALDNDSAVRWDKRHGKKYPWLHLIKRYTKANQVQGSLKLLLDRKREDNTIPFTLIYCKATHTKRWQHAEGLRIQNLDRGEVEGINLRHTLIPRPGYVFVIADLSQIEPRILNYRAGDLAFLHLCAQGQSPYEAHARATMGYTGKEKLKVADPQLYSLAKARTLALGYQAGPEQFQEMAWSMCGLKVDLDQQTVHIDGHIFTFDEFQEIVTKKTRPEADHWNQLYQTRSSELVILPSATQATYDFRDSSPYITKFWNRRMNEVCASEGGNYILPVGDSTLKYFDVEVKKSTAYSKIGRRYEKREARAWVVKNSKNIKDKKYLYGGKIVENEIQWLGREVFAYCYWRASKLPHVHPVFSVHDEGIWEVPEQHAEELLPQILDCMGSAPPWASDLPVAAEGEICECYTK